eukprot:116487-Rhodomonas_salina.2
MSEEARRRRGGRGGEGGGGGQLAAGGDALGHEQRHDRHRPHSHLLPSSPSHTPPLFFLLLLLCLHPLARVVSG